METESHKGLDERRSTVSKEPQLETMSMIPAKLLITVNEKKDKHFILKK